LAQEKAGTVNGADIHLPCPIVFRYLCNGHPLTATLDYVDKTDYWHRLASHPSWPARFNGKGFKKFTTSCRYVRPVPESNGFKQWFIQVGDPNGQPQYVTLQDARKTYRFVNAAATPPVNYNLAVRLVSKDIRAQQQVTTAPNPALKGVKTKNYGTGRRCVLPAHTAVASVPAAPSVTVSAQPHVHQQTPWLNQHTAVLLARLCLDWAREVTKGNQSYELWATQQFVASRSTLHPQTKSPTFQLAMALLSAGATTADWTLRLSDSLPVPDLLTQLAFETEDGLWQLHPWRLCPEGLVSATDSATACSLQDLLETLSTSKGTTPEAIRQKARQILAAGSWVQSPQV